MILTSSLNSFASSMLVKTLPLQGLENTQTFGEFLEAGGPMMIPIGICSVFVVAFALERYFSLTRRRVCPAVVREIVVDVEDGKFEEAERRVLEVRTPATRIMAAGLRRRGFEIRDIEIAMEDQALKEVERLRKNVRPLALIGAIAPLMGLLGTVLGIAESFRIVSNAGMGKPEMLAGGINEALTTTIAGLVVAIPALIICAHLQGKLRRLIAHTDETVAPVIECLALKPHVGESDAA
ncbi:MAG: MotA/TolQ/ExbB proton channel family protein [Planctomycetota bacterium]|jgi:biopolymer transport protein ExbB